MLLLAFVGCSSWSGRWCQLVPVGVGLCQLLSVCVSCGWHGGRSQGQAKGCCLRSTGVVFAPNRVLSFWQSLHESLAFEGVRFFLALFLHGPTKTTNHCQVVKKRVPAPSLAGGEHRPSSTKPPQRSASQPGGIFENVPLHLCGGSAVGSQHLLGSEHWTTWAGNVIAAPPVHGEAAGLLKLQSKKMLRNHPQILRLSLTLQQTTHLED